MKLNVRTCVTAGSAGAAIICDLHFNQAYFTIVIYIAHDSSVAWVFSWSSKKIILKIDFFEVQKVFNSRRNTVKIEIHAV